MIYLDYTVLIIVIFLTPFNRKALLFVCAFIFCEVLYYSLGFYSENGGLLFSAAASISFVIFTLIAALLKFDKVLILSLVTYWLLFFFTAIDYSLTNSINYFDIVCPWAIKAVDAIVIIHLYNTRYKRINLTSDSDMNSLDKSV